MPKYTNIILTSILAVCLVNTWILYSLFKTKLWDDFEKEDNSSEIVSNLIKKEAKVISHSFEPWDRTKFPFPCVAEDSPETQGIFYVKVPKTSSTTLSKITIRIVGREAKRQ